MNKDRWQQIDTIIDQVLAVNSEEERTALIESKCGGDESLRTEVLQLLDSIESSKDAWEHLLFFMADMTPRHITSKFLKDKNIPNKLGLYTIKKRLGRGGMGDVFLAERSGEKFHKKVALKVLRKEINSDEQIKRFVQERSILSSLNHPNIARMLDGGLSEDGRPFYVMEYVEGIPITEYCKNHNCSLSQRLALFSQVCRAVQYAHTNFVVHRDIKPANLLVTEDEKVKVLDFGIAKLLDQKLTHQTLLETRAGQRMLSLNYAAPEQVTLEPITSATDVYALGLLLYELLTGSKAFELSGKKLREAEQIIREKDPKKTSELKTVFRKKLHGDLDAIVMKALRKEPKQRYESASRLFEDIERYQSKKPVHARKGTFRYRAGKFVRRNKIVLTAAALFLVAAITFGTYHIYEVNEERDIAKLEAAKATQVTDFLVGIFQNANPWQDPSKNDLTVTEIFDEGTEYIQNEIKEQPELRASLLSAVGEIHQSLGNNHKAAPLLKEALSIEEKLLDEGKGSQYDLAVYSYRLGILQNFTAEYASAIQNLSRASAIFDKLDLELEFADAILAQGWAEFSSANYDKSESLVHTANDIYRIHFGTNSRKYADGLKHLAWIENDRGNYRKADSLVSEVLRVHRLYYAGDHPAIAQTMHSLAWMIVQQKPSNLERAFSYNKEALDMKLRLFEKPNFKIAITMNTLGLIYQKMGNLDEAEQYYQEALEMHRATLAENHPFALKTMRNIASLHIEKGELGKGIQMYRHIVEAKREVKGNNPGLGVALYYLAKALYQNDSHAESITCNLEALSILKKYFRDSHPYALRIRNNLAEAYEAIGQFKDAEKMRLTNFELIKEEKGIDNPQTQSALKNIISLYEKWNKGQERQEFEKLLTKSD